MAEPYVSTNSVGCATPSKSSIYHYKSLKELFNGIGKDDFEFWGDRYLRFQEVYDYVKPHWRFALWGNIRTVDFSFMMMKDYPTIARAMGRSIIFQMNNKKLAEAQMQLGDLLEQQQMLGQSVPEEPRHVRPTPPDHIM